jgi:2Fe-2S ferredoxin
MPQITIDNLNNKIISYPGEDRVLTLIQQDFVDWMHACGGKGRCTTCKMIVLSGMEALTSPSPFEKKCRDRGLLKQEERLACQCRASGDIIIKVPEECKLPHIHYTD